MFSKLLRRLFPSRIPHRPLRERLSLEALESREVPATFLWIGNGQDAVGAQKTSWDYKQNWEVLAGGSNDPTNPDNNLPTNGSMLSADDGAPNSGDTFLFTNASKVDCNVNTTFEVAGLVIDGYTQHLILNKNLTVDSGSLKTLTPTVNTYTVGGSSNFIIASGATFTWYSGTFANRGLYVTSRATLNIESDTAQGKDARLAGARLSISPAVSTVAAGTVNFTSGQIFLQGVPWGTNGGSSFIDNFGNFFISGSATGILAANNGQQGTFSNYGALQLNLDNPTNTFRVFTQFKDTLGTAKIGQATINEGQFLLDGSGSTGGLWQIAEGQSVLFQQLSGDPVPNFTWNGGAQFKGDGTVGVYLATITIPKNATVTANNLVFQGGTLFGQGDSSNVTAAAPSVLYITNSMLWSGGATAGNGILTLDASATLTIFGNPIIPSGPPQLYNWTIFNKGTIRLGAPSGPQNVTSINFLMNSSATITNSAGSQMVLVDGSNILLGQGATLGKINVEKGATLRKPSNAGRSVIQAQITNDNGNVINVSAGSTVILQDASGAQTGKVIGKGTLGGTSFLGPANLDGPFGVAAGGALVGDGEITTANFTNAGTVLPGDAGTVGTLSFIGNFTNYFQDANNNITPGTLAMDLGGGNNPVAGTDYDQIVVSNGQLTLGGSLQLSILPTLSTQVGTVFTLIDDNESSSPLTTTFANLPDGSQISVAGWVFKINYNSTANPDGTDHNTVTLTVVSTPETSTNTASVSGLVWVDQNRDGIDNAGEPTAAGITVTLINMTTGNSTRTVTDSNGAYNFQSLAAGTYKVQFDPTANSTYANYRFTTNNADSLAIPSTGITAPFTLSNSQQLTNINAGLVSNTPPVGADDSYTVNRNGSLNIPASAGVLSNDTDAANESLTAALVSGPQNGTLALNTDGSFSYIPNTNFVGTDSFSYQPVDASGPGSVAYVTIKVTEPSPTANNTSASTNMDSPVTINVLANASDPDGDTLSVTDAFGALSGTTDINQDGTVTYKPADGFIGTDTFTVTISDGYGGTVSATVTVTVNAVTGQPVAGDEEVMTSQDTATEVDLSELVSDTNADSSNLTYTVGDAQNGTVTLLADGHTAEFTPDANYQGYASFTFTVTDSTTGRSDSGTTTVSVNSSPTAANLNFSTNEGTPITVNVLSSASNRNGDTLSVAALDGANGKAGVNPESTITYDPAKGWYGTDSFTYAVYDAFGGVAFATVTVTVNALPPTAKPGSLTTQPGISVGIDLSSLASDVNMPSANLTYSVSGAQGGTVTLMGTTAQFTPMSGFTGQAQFSYTVTDPITGLSASSVVTVTVNGTVSASNASASTPAGTAVTVTPAYSGGTIASFTQGAHGTVSLSRGGFLYKPANSTYTGTDTFQYTVSDGNGHTATGMITITITSSSGTGSSPPLATGYTAYASSSPITLSIQALASDPNGYALTIISITAPTYGTVSIAPDGQSLTYSGPYPTPYTDSFTYTVSDGHGGTATGTVTIYP